MNEKPEQFPPWRDDADYIVDEYGQTAMYWKAGGKRKKESGTHDYHELQKQ